MNALLSPAKLNLFLHITNKRDDGYHELQTVFRLLDWGDNMRFEVSDDHFHLPSPTPFLEKNLFLDKKEGEFTPIRLHCDKQLTNNPNDNLIIKSAFALLSAWLNTVNEPIQPPPTPLLEKEGEYSSPSLPIIDIYLDKRIPTGAGLGGGSSNSATTLMMLNQLWQLNFGKQQLQAIGATLGADVPIFIYGQDAIAEGIGEVFTPITLNKQRFLLLMPSAHISTAQLFAHPKLQRDCTKLSTAQIIQQANDFTNNLNSPFCNVFQPVVCALSDEVKTALNYLRQFESLTNSTARMTGSGSCVFLPLPIAENKDFNQQILAKWINDAPCSTVVVDSL